METGAIHTNANRHFEQASVFRNSMEDLRREIKAAKSEQKLHFVRGMQLVVRKGINPSDGHTSRKVAQEFERVRQLTQAAKERQYRVWRLDRRVQSAIDKAHVLIRLARRASDGHVYAKHQADTMLGRQ
jgi:hypothetical protein